MTITEAYGALGVDPATAVPDQVRAAFKRLILSSHPDTFVSSEDKRKAHDRTIRLIDAYQALKAAGFPRPVYTESSSEEPWRAAYSEAERTTATRGTAWKPQPDKGDAAFDSWVHDLGVGAFYAEEMVKHGAPVAIAKTLYGGISGVFGGALIFCIGIFSLAPRGRFDPSALLVSGVGLALFLGSAAYLISPIVYYVRRKRAGGPQLAGAAVSNWPHPERMPDLLRWVLVGPSMILGLYAGVFAGALVGLPLSLINSGAFTLGLTLGAVLGGLLMSRWAAWMAPRNKSLISLSSAALLILFVPVVALLVGVPLPWDHFVASVVGNVPGLIGVALGSLPELFPAYRSVGLWKRGRDAPIPYGALASTGFILALALGLISNGPQSSVAATGPAVGPTAAAPLASTNATSAEAEEPTLNPSIEVTSAAMAFSPRAQAVQLLSQMRSLPAHSDTRAFFGYGFDLLKSNSRFAAAYRSLLNGAGARLRDAPGMLLNEGVGIPTEIVQTPNGRLVLAGICKPHDCGDDYGWYVYDLDAGKMTMWMYYDGSESWLGTPPNPDTVAAIIAVRARRSAGLADSPFPLPVAERPKVTAAMSDLP